MALMASHIASQLSGSIAGTTYGRAKGGIYMRARAVPVQPQSPAQQTVRNSLAALSALWGNTLTDSQRVAWNLYGANVPVVNSLGTTIFLSGQNWFIACNTPAQAAQDVANTGLQFLPLVSPIGDIIVDAPTIFDRGNTGAFSLTVAGADTLLSFDETQDWVNTDNAFALIYLSKPFNPGRTFFNGPWRLNAAITGSSTIPPTSPLSLSFSPPSYNPPSGSKIQVQVVTRQADGRLSTPTLSSQVIAP
jgi:hypothetical protein